MTNGAIAATVTASELVAADEFRGEVVLQHVSGNPVFLAFGTDVPVVDSGIVLSSEFPVVRVRGARAMQAINGICDTGQSAAGTYTTDPEVEIQCRGGGSVLAQVPVAKVTMTGTLANDKVALPANCVKVYFKLTATAYVNAADTVPGASSGIQFPANLVYPMDVSGAAYLWGEAGAGDLQILGFITE